MVNPMSGLFPFDRLEFRGSSCRGLAVVHVRARFALWPSCARKGSLRSLDVVRMQGLASLTCHHAHAMDSYARMQMCSGTDKPRTRTDRRKLSGDGQTQDTQGRTETFWGRTNPGHARTDGK